MIVNKLRADCTETLTESQHCDSPVSHRMTKVLNAVKTSVSQILKNISQSGFIWKEIDTKKKKKVIWSDLTFGSEF